MKPPLTHSPLGPHPLVLRTGGATGVVGSFGPVRVGADGKPKLHKGVDLLCDIGTAVHAAHDGVVLVSGHVNGYGLCIYLDDGEGREGFETRYAHLSAAHCGVGRRVAAGDLIAHSGNTGNAAGTPPHMHFELRFDGEAVDPWEYLT